MMALSGVRSSWLILARNSDLVRLANSACSLALRRSAVALSWSVMSVKVTTEPPAGIGRCMISMTRPEMRRWCRMRSSRLTADLEALGDDALAFLGTVVAPPHADLHQLPQGDARPHQLGRKAEQLQIAPVAQDQALLCVVHAQALAHVGERALELLGLGGDLAAEIGDRGLGLDPPADLPDEHVGHEREAEADRQRDGAMLHEAALPARLDRLERGRDLDDQRLVGEDAIGDEARVAAVPVLGFVAADPAGGHIVLEQIAVLGGLSDEVGKMRRAREIGPVMQEQLDGAAGRAQRAEALDEIVRRHHADHDAGEIAIVVDDAAAEADKPAIGEPAEERLRDLQAQRGSSRCAMK